GTVTFTELATGTTTAFELAAPRPLSSFTITPDGRFALSVTARRGQGPPVLEMSTWDVKARRRLRPPVEAAGSHLPFPLSPDGRNLAVAPNLQRMPGSGPSSTIRVVDTHTGRDRFPPIHASAGAFRMSFDASGNRLMLQLVRVLPLPPRY